MSKREVKNICVFCGSRTGDDPAFTVAAETFGRAVAARGFTLVYGGARVGLMGAVANAALAAGGQVIGVLPKALVSKEVAHDALTELYLTESMHERKNRMITLSDAFVALPGGFGTLDELFETITLAQIGIHDKPSALLDTSGFFAPLVTMFRHVLAHGFAAPEDEGFLLVDRDVDRLLDAIVSWTPPPPSKVRSR
jgi:uncharacterized protein (TIGR00730 family)